MYKIFVGKHRNSYTERKLILTRNLLLSMLGSIMMLPVWAIKLIQCSIW